MSKYSKKDILRMVEDEDVEFIRLQFTDIFGSFKNMAITKAQLTAALDGEIVFDGSSIDGFARIEESDMYLKPDPDTFVIFPWRPQVGKVARLICDICKSDGTPFEADCRNLLKSAMAKAKKAGYEVSIGTELEFFLFETDEQGQPTTNPSDKAGYFDIAPLDGGENARRDMVLTLEEMGFSVTGSHHEQAPGQHEIDFTHSPALETADNIQTFKMAVKTVAKRHGMHATFMPKPTAGITGSGMHINISLEKKGKNVFFDPKDENRLSKEGYYFMGGIMKHACALAALTNPLANSYKRLVPGFDAAVYVAWSKVNRSPLIRVPVSKGQNTRIELRFPDPSANPYLAIAAIITAGLAGISGKIDPPARIDTNIFAMTPAERMEAGIRSLPQNLGQALECLEEDELIMDVLGEYAASRYLMAKKEEFREYSEFVSEWELASYLGKY